MLACTTRVLPRCRIMTCKAHLHRTTAMGQQLPVIAVVQCLQYPLTKQLHVTYAEGLQCGSSIHGMVTNGEHAHSAFPRLNVKRCYCNMGIENDIIKRYGRRYWIANRDKILARADKYSQLQTNRTFPNAKQRRIIKRMLSRREIDRVEAKRIAEYITEEEYEGNPAELVISE